MKRLLTVLVLALTACHGGEIRPRSALSTTDAPTTTPRAARTTTTVEFVGPGSVGGAFPSVTELAHPKISEPEPARPRYIRDEWDPGWADDDGDGCNTRAEVLMMESSKPVLTKPNNCTVLTGAWIDWYTGKEYSNAALLQVDHLVALGDAASSGGWRWSADRKIAFLNDLDDAWQLNAVAGDVNQRKADSGPDKWLPPLESFRCTYVAAYAGIKARWGLTVTPAQWAAIESTWKGCS